MVFHACNFPSQRSSQNGFTSHEHGKHFWVQFTFKSNEAISIVCITAVCSIAGNILSSPDVSFISTLCSAAQKVLQSEIAEKAVDMGFDPVKVERTILQKLRQNAEGYTSVEALIEDISAQESDSTMPEKSGKCFLSFFLSLKVCFVCKGFLNEVHQVNSSLVFPENKAMLCFRFLLKKKKKSVFTFWLPKINYF